MGDQVSPRKHSLAVTQAYNCSYNAHLDANPDMKKWVELNPDMAAKERVKLQSVD
jgi:hypothetical protein